MKKWRGWFAGSDQSKHQNLPFDLNDIGFIADPAPHYQLLRDAHPIVEVRSGGFLLTRHADIVAAFSNPVLGNAPSRFSVLSARNRQKSTAAGVAAHIPPFLDKPEHVPTRQMLSSAFFKTFADVDAKIAVEATELVSLATGQQVDLIRDIARPFVCRVMADFIGLPDDPTAIKSASESFFHLFAPVRDRGVFEQVNKDLDLARAFIEGAVRDRLLKPANDLISHLLETGMDPTAVTDNAFLMLADGIENIEAGIAVCFDLSLLHRDDIPADATAAEVTKECLRLATPGQIIPRVTRQACQILGQKIGEGVPVYLALGSANLDPLAHNDPTAFRLDRTDESDVMFGRGRHTCIGAPLGLAQISAMLTALLAAGAERCDDAPLRYHARFGHRWPRAMNVRL